MVRASPVVQNLSPVNRRLVKRGQASPVVSRMVVTEILAKQAENFPCHDRKLNFYRVHAHSRDLG